MGTTSRDSPTIRRPILTPVQRGDREGETACFEPESPHDLARGLVGDLIWALQTALSVPRARMGR
jgi:hypothetical protein